MAIENGDTVQVHYTGRLEDGHVFDSSEGRGPLEFKVGAGQVIPGFDQAVAGQDVGAKTTVEVPPEQGYGPHDPNMVQTLDRARVQGEGFEEGQVLGLQDDEGRPFQATVVGLDDDKITLDFNHFLAGKTLVFDIEVVGVAEE